MPSGFNAAGLYYMKMQSRFRLPDRSLWRILEVSLLTGFNGLTLIYPDRYDMPCRRLCRTFRYAPPWTYISSKRMSVVPSCPFFL